jgi:hypothetical protein
LSLVEPARSRLQIKARSGHGVAVFGGTLPIANEFTSSDPLRLDHGRQIVDGSSRSLDPRIAARQARSSSGTARRDAMAEFEAETTLGRQDEAQLALGTPVFDPSHYVTIPLRLHAPGIDGRPAIGLDLSTSIELEGWGRWIQGFLAYVDDLAANWRGWAGAKEWLDDGRNVRLSSTHDSHGTVSVEVAVAHGAPAAWSARVIVPCDPGALPSFAVAVHRMLRAAPWPFDYGAPEGLET